ncbi:hypothetical protein [Candidatus Methanocrinis natronophilus]|uniref:Uncharacterized protein n=1 Tax=Candidatus Methanocrinis natronophilus TaxID=3033396 RepID=A0ABT5XA60_9EURY|nr:hypothetical protein [Candidatus Methanocrinis natronophilus]MDF0591577.1 hypothetical protein [Candidatus Methanocrinis natronophilus]
MRTRLQHPQSRIGEEAFWPMELSDENRTVRPRRAPPRLHRISAFPHNASERVHQDPAPAPVTLTVTLTVAVAADPDELLRIGPGRGYDGNKILSDNDSRVPIEGG